MNDTAPAFRLESTPEGEGSHTETEDQQAQSTPADTLGQFLFEGICDSGFNTQTSLAVA